MKAKNRKSKRAARTSNRRSSRARKQAPRSRPQTAIVRQAARVDGVNVNDLVVMAEAVKNDPALAEYTFRASTHWLGGAHAKTKIHGFWGSGREDASRKHPFVIETDEPGALLGTNRAPSPVEFLLAGLGASLAEGIAYNAAARGITLEAIDVELQGGLDVRGSLGIRESGKANDAKDLRPGFQSIRIVCNLKSQAPPSELKELVEYTKETSPVLDMFRHPVPVAVEINH